MPNDFGGIERYLCHLSQALLDAGQEVVVTAPPGSPLAQNLPLKAVPHAFRHKYDLKGIAGLIRLIQGEKPRALFAHFSPDYVPSGIAAKLAKSAPLVIVRHVAVPWKPQKARLYSRLAHGFIGVSEAVSQSVRSTGLECRTCLSGISPLKPTLNRLTAREKFGLDGFCVGTLGRIVPEKGHATVLAALTPDLPLTYHIFGSGSYEATLREKAKGLPVVFQGRTNDVAEATLGLDAVLIPSVWAEAFSLVVLEAMSLGKAIVASEVGGIPEAIVSGESGLLLPPDDPMAWQNSLFRLQNDGELVMRLGAAAKDRFESEFQLHHFSQRFLTTSSDLLPSPVPS
jgi:glycosyltransferase involved in cell wall biosynthesis